MNVQEGLNRAIHYLEERIRDKLSGGGYPSGNDEYRSNYIPIQDSVIIHEAESIPDGYRASLLYGGEDAPYALAYEYGSGEHAEGGGNSYPIYPVDASALYFYWDRISADVLVPKRGGATYYIPSSNLLIIGKGRVDHPGIEAKPYANPTLEEEKEKIRDIIGEDFVAQIGVLFEDVFDERVRIEVSI